MIETFYQPGKWVDRKRRIHALALVVCCLLAGCHRAPRTATELQKSLPQQYRGELHVQGEPSSRKIVVEPHDFTVLDPHLLEFNRVRYQLLDGSEVGASGDLQIRGTISAPGLAIHLEERTGNAEADGGDAFKTGTFHGTLSGDLQKLNATWKTGYGQGVTLEMEAAP